MTTITDIRARVNAVETRIVDEIAFNAATVKAMLELIATTRATMNEGLDALAREVGAAADERERAMRDIIGSPAISALRLAAE